MKTLKLFNAVLKKESDALPITLISQGIIIEPGATHLVKEISDYYIDNQLNGDDLNKSFHKSWSKIKNSSRFDLFVDQIRHYISTYGTDFQGEVYIPAEVLNIPELKSNLVYKVVKAYTKEEMTVKCLDMLKSGIALSKDTIIDLISILIDQLDYKFTGNEGIKNKEASIVLADLYNIYPTDTVEFFRYILYKATGASLLIKDFATISAVKSSSYNPKVQFDQFGLKKLAEIFNRFKPLFLAFKSQCPKTINKISKLSKTYHKPLITNPLNEVTSKLLTDDKMHWLDNASPYALFKALNVCYTKAFQDNTPQTVLYRIRNGKSFVKADVIHSDEPAKQNLAVLLMYLQSRFDLTGKKIYFPKKVKYAIPTSEKMYVGNIPTGTKFYGKKLAVGMYWEDSWGARDLDLSGQHIDGTKVGWNSSYNSDGLYYSGDITSAEEGAVEYLYASKKLKSAVLVNMNVFNGSATSGFNIIVGKGDKVTNDYMMNPNNLMLSVKTESIQEQMILGIIIQENDKQAFVLLNFGQGCLRVSRNSSVSHNALLALHDEWVNKLSFNELVSELGAEIVDTPEEADYDLSLDRLEKDSFTKIFSNIPQLAKV